MFWGAKYFSNRIEKLHKMTFINFLLLLKKFEKVEKTGIISTKFSYDVLHLLYSAILLKNAICATDKS